MPKLIYNDPDTGSRVVVEIDQEMSEVTVGRNPGNIIRINNPSVSRRHTKFVYENGEVTLYDLNSSNGTYVNGMRIQEQILEDGDLVRVGEFPLEFVHEQDLASTQVEEGHIADAAEPQSEMKSTHMGVGAMGMDDGEGRGGAMSPAGGNSQTRQEFSDAGREQTAGGRESDAEEEFVLGEEDIEEVTEAGEIEPEAIEEVGDADPLAPDLEGADDDPTVEASVEEITRAEGGDSSGVFGDPEPESDDAQTRRADGDAIAAELQGAVQESTQAEGDGGEVAELQQQVAELRAELEKAPDREELESLAAERDEALDRVEDLEARIEEKDGIIAEKDRELSERDGDVRELEQKLESRDDEIASLEDAVDELERELESRDERIDARETSLEEAEAGGGIPAGNAGLEAELRDKEEELEELRDEVARLEEEDEKKKAIFEELSGDLRDLVAQKDELQEELETVRRERDSLLDTIDELESGGGAAAGGGGEGAEEYQELLEEKESLEDTLAEVILERDRLEDELAEEREAG